MGPGPSRCVAYLLGRRLLLVATLKRTPLYFWDSDPRQSGKLTAFGSRSSPPFPYDPTMSSSNSFSGRRACRPSGPSHHVRSPISPLPSSSSSEPTPAVSSRRLRPCRHPPSPRAACARAHRISVAGCTRAREEDAMKQRRPSMASQGTAAGHLTGDSSPTARAPAKRLPPTRSTQHGTSNSG